jgi:hypothetical protein
LNRLLLLACGIVLLMSPHALLAQHGGHGAGVGRPSTGPSNPAPNSDMSDFSRAVALQATPDQIARFQQSKKSTDAAKKLAQDITQASFTQTKDTSQPNSSLYAGLNDAVEDAQSTNLQFLRSFSASQQSGLKPLIKKLSKADADVSKQSKALAQELERSESSGKKLASVVEKLTRRSLVFKPSSLA